VRTTSSIPTVPPDAAPWPISQALGKDAIAAAWQTCFDAGRAAGSIEAYGHGIAHASIAWLALFLVLWGSLSLASSRRRPQ
jgi:hypothetical protein